MFLATSFRSSTAKKHSMGRESARFRQGVAAQAPLLQALQALQMLQSRPWIILMYRSLQHHLLAYADVS